MKLLVTLSLFAVAISVLAEKPNYTELYFKMKAGVLKQPYPVAPDKLLSLESEKISKNERWCFVGDSGVEGLAQESVAKSVYGEIKCNRVYHLGDMVYPVGIKSPADPNLKTRFLNYHKPFKLPFYFVLGDHEYYGLDVSPWTTVAQSYTNLNFPYYYYGHNVDGVCVVAADTTPFYRGSLTDPRTSAQMKWFEKKVPSFLKDCSFKIFISHHSYDTLNTKRKPPLKKYKASLRTFFEKNVLGKFDVVFSGHDHALAYIGNFKGTDQYISGAGGKFTSNKDSRMDLKSYKSHKGPGLIYLEIVNKKPFRGAVKMVTLEGKKFNSLKIVPLKKY
jgi:hypothetical protein